MSYETSDPDHPELRSCTRGLDSFASCSFVEHSSSLKVALSARSVSVVLE